MAQHYEIESRRTLNYALDNPLQYQVSFKNRESNNSEVEISKVIVQQCNNSEIQRKYNLGTVYKLKVENKIGSQEMTHSIQKNI